MTFDAQAAWKDALAATRLIANNPIGLGGVCVRAHAGPVRDAWMQALRAQMPSDMPCIRLPNSIAMDRLVGGLDLTATISAKKPVLQTGLLADANGGLIIVPMAERMPQPVIGALIEMLDQQSVTIERDGITHRSKAGAGLILFDESEADETGPPKAILDRIGLFCSLDQISVRDTVNLSSNSKDSDAVADVVTSVCTISEMLGIEGHRATQFAVTAAQQLALSDARPVTEGNIEQVTRLCLMPKARRLPVPPEVQPTETEAPSPPEQSSSDPGDGAIGELADRVVETVKTQLPSDILAGLAQAASSKASASQGKGSSGVRLSQRRGRPAGVRAGMPRQGARLHLVETLRAAAPWQTLRRGNGEGVQIRKSDFRIRRFAERSESLLIFVVDASGSAAAERLNEAKGAVELLLAQAYAKRTSVALIAFRGTTAELIVPPTRSLVRAKRCLSDMVGGGATPLASGVTAGLHLALASRRQGRTPFLIMLTDGRGNVSIDGEADKARASDDALASARAIRQADIKGVLIDIAARPREAATEMATTMGMPCVQLPRHDRAAIGSAISALTP